MTSYVHMSRAVVQGVPAAGGGACNACASNSLHVLLDCGRLLQREYSVLRVLVTSMTPLANLGFLDGVTLGTRASEH